MNRRMLVTGLTTVAVVLAGCGEERLAPEIPSDDDPALPDPAVLPADLNLTQVVQDLVTANCEPVDATTDPATPLYLVPITAAFTIPCDPQNIFAVTAPDGHHVTFDEWDAAAGAVTMTCLEGGGTRFDVELRGLIPNGVYTIWQFPPEAGGALASHPPDDIHNVFVADANGAVSGSAIVTAGPMTLFGSVDSCQLPAPSRGALTGGVYMVVLYHTDNQAYGPLPGPEQTGIAHLFVMGL